MRVLCFEIEYVGFWPKWRKLARAGQKIAAIKELRLEKQNKNKDYGLKEAKDDVEAFMSLKGYKTVW